MSPRTRAFLGVAAVIILAVAFWVSVDRRAYFEESVDGQLWLPSLGGELNDISKVQIRTSPEDQVTIEVGDDHWRVLERNGYPADDGIVRALIFNLSKAEILEQKTSNPEYFPRLGLADIGASEGVATQLVLDGLSSPIDILVGKRARSDSGTYVRRNQDNQTFLIDQPLQLPSSPTSWLQREIADFDRDEIESVTILHPDGERVRLQKTTKDQPNYELVNLPEGASLKSQSITNATATALSGLTLEDVKRYDAATEEQAAVVRARFDFFDGRRVMASTTNQADGESWVRFEGDVDLEQARKIAIESVRAQASVAETEVTTADQAAEGANAATGAAVEIDTFAVDAKVKELVELMTDWNQSVNGWSYKLPAYKAAHLVRRIDEYVNAPELVQ